MRSPRIRRVAHICKRKLRVLSQMFGVSAHVLLQRRSTLRGDRHHFVRSLLYDRPSSFARVSSVSFAGSSVGTASALSRWVCGDASLCQSIAEMARECPSEIRTVQPMGPYLAGGYCFAGAVAIEIAQQLLHEGEDVRLLALIDSLRPNAVHSFLVNLINSSDYFKRRGHHIREVIGNLLAARDGSRRIHLMARKLKTLRPKSGSDSLPENSRDISSLIGNCSCDTIPSRFSRRESWASGWT
jgi:hypothetical protein